MNTTKLKRVPMPTTPPSSAPQTVTVRPPVPNEYVPRPLTPEQLAVVESKQAEIEQVDNSFRVRTGSWRAGISKANNRMTAMIEDVAEEMQSVAKDHAVEMEMRIGAAATVGDLAKAHTSSLKLALEIGELDNLAEEKPKEGALKAPPQWVVQATNVQINQQPPAQGSDRVETP